jgi:hypothetical protein
MKNTLIRYCGAIFVVMALITVAATAQRPSQREPLHPVRRGLKIPIDLQNTTSE